MFANCKNAEDIFKDATSIKSMVNSKNVALNHRNLESYLVEFPDANSAETAVESLNGKDVSVICVKDFKDNLELAEKENNLGELGNEPERKIVIIHPMDASVIGNMFPSAASITKVRQNGLTVVEDIASDTLRTFVMMNSVKFLALSTSTPVTWTELTWALYSPPGW